MRRHALNVFAPTYLMGSNAMAHIIKTMEDNFGTGETIDFFIASRLSQYLSHPLAGRVHEEDVCRIHQHLIETYGLSHAKTLSWQAGQKSADYLLKNKISKPLRFILKRLPIRWSITLLLREISNHAWTFVGSGVFTYQVFKSITFYIESNPICRGIRASEPICDYYAAIFEGLFKNLIHPSIVVKELGCEAQGDPSCSFSVKWSESSS